MPGALNLISDIVRRGLIEASVNIGQWALYRPLLGEISIYNFRLVIPYITENI